MAPILTTGAGVYAAIGGGGGYTGPGDISSGAAIWGGLRGYSAAYSTGSNAGVDLVDQAGANPITINILSNGNLDVSSISTWVAAHTVTTICITKLYDQSGNSRHFVQATLANMPTLILNAVGSLPGIGLSGSQWLETSSGFVTQADPYYASWAAKRTSVASFAGVLSQDSARAIAGFQNSANTLLMYDGGFGTVSGASTTDGTFQAVESLFNGASSTFFYNGIGPTTVNASSNGLLSNEHVGLGAAPGGGALNLTGVVLEAGYWLSDKSSTQSTLNSNKKTYWGI